MDGGSNPRTLLTSPLSITHTRTHCDVYPDSPRYPHARGTGTANQGTCQHNLLPWQRGRSRRGPFPTLLLSPSLHLSGHKRGLLAYTETRIKVAGGALNVANLPFKLLHPSFSFSFCFFLSLLCLFPLLSRKRMPSQEGRGEGSL